MKTLIEQLEPKITQNLACLVIVLLFYTLGYCFNMVN